MQVVKQIRACFITFILLISSLSLFIFPAEDSKAQDLELDEILLILAGFHPYITPGVYVNDGEETVHVLGDVDFDLYYSTSLSAEFQNKDDIKVKIYKIISGSFFPTEIDNATLKKTLQPKKLGDVIQKTSLKIKDMDIYLEPGDAILVTVEIIQSGKPIGNIIERIDDKRLKSNLKRLANSFNSSEVEELNNLGSFIDEFIDILEITSVTKDDIASLVNSFSSSSFVYNSSTYPSSITLPFELKENLTLKFRSVLYDEQDFDEEDENRSEIPIMVELTNKSLNGTAITWPTRIINPETKEFDQFGYVLWFAAWSQFLLLDDPTIPEEED